MVAAMMVPRLLEDPVVGTKVAQAHRPEVMARVEVEAASAMGAPLETTMTP
jgi:hypothetical protein